MVEFTYQHIACRVESGILVMVLKDEKISGDEMGDAIRQEMLGALAQSGCNKVVIDFSAVKYLSSAGFRPLLSLHRKLQELRGRMIFCNLSPEIAEVFIVTRLIASSRSVPAPFEKAGDLADALARFRHHSVRLENGVLIVSFTENRLQGDDVADRVNEGLLATVAETGAQKVVLDFKDVQIITTACLRPVLNLRNSLHAKGGRLVLCNLQPPVAEVLRATRLIPSGSAGPVPLEAAADVPAALGLLTGG